MTASKSARTASSEPPPPGLGGRDAEVEVDVGVHAQQQVLQDDRPPSPGSSERHPPRLRAWLPVVPGAFGGEVASGETGDEPLHAVPIGEATLVGALAHHVGDGQVHGGEVAGAVLGGGTAPDDLGQRVDHAVEGGGGSVWHRVVTVAPAPAVRIVPGRVALGSAP